MLGKHHIAISLGIIFPFIIPLLFLEGIDFVPICAFIISVLIGSLLPDSDCKGRATIYYRFKEIDWIMKKIVIKSVVKVFRLFVSKRYNLSYEVKEEHRGIMHSPIGILISSLLLTLLVLIFSFLLKLFNPLIILLIFIGLLIGQILHLIEDSLTISGINWKFPFGDKKISGKIYTFQKIENKKDIRPEIFQYSLFIFSAIIFLLYALDKINLNLIFVYIVICFFSLAIIIINIIFSKKEWKFWYQDSSLKKKFKSIRNY